MSGPNAAPEQGLQNYRTPAAFLEAVKRRFELAEGFDWDLACDSANCVAPDGCGYTFDTGVDALAQDWRELADPALTNWINPPFGQSRLFAAKCAGSGARILGLFPVALGTQWWKKYVHNVAHVVGVGRIVFDQPDGSGPVVAWNKKKETWEPSPINRDCALLAYNILSESTPRYLLEDWRDW
jgi:hypothetical protein